MSILIKGMNMPTSCCACMFSRTDIRNVDWCVLTEKDLPCDCPIVPVPEHGRLIDADRLRHSHCAECTLYPDNCLGDECDWDSIFHIDHAPTIIPADPADKEEE